ncbi:hypothetical protein AAVH_04402 [Aphelenchoides avenae]|nr:hypothetical protein AAVH_04402 [Aphelenchus avenae]
MDASGKIQGGPSPTTSSVPSAVTARSPTLKLDATQVPTVRTDTPTKKAAEKDRAPEKNPAEPPTTDQPADQRRSLPVRIVLGIWNFLLSIPEILYTIWNILRLMYLMMWYMYRYPNASRHAAYIGYRTALVTYNYRLYRLVFLFGSKNDQQGEAGKTATPGGKPAAGSQTNVTGPAPPPKSPVKATTNPTDKNAAPTAAKPAETTVRHAAGAKQEKVD